MGPALSDRASVCGLRAFQTMVGELDGLAVESKRLRYRGYAETPPAGFLRQEVFYETILKRSEIRNLTKISMGICSPKECR